jgi:hypothetical protein
LKIQVMTEEQANSQIITWTRSTWLGLASRRLSVNRCGSFRTESEPHNYFGYWASGIRARTYIVDGLAIRLIRCCKPEFCRILMHNAIVWGRITNRFRWTGALQPTITSVTGNAHGRKWKGNPIYPNSFDEMWPGV